MSPIRPVALLRYSEVYRRGHYEERRGRVQLGRGAGALGAAVQLRQTCRDEYLLMIMERGLGSSES